MTYERVAFELAGDADRFVFEDPPDVSWKVPDDDEELVDVLAGALSVSIDPRDQAAVRAAGARAVATSMLEDARAGQPYHYERKWWSILATDGVPAGFVLPVVFSGCARGALDEGTIYHIGVRPEHRSRGFGRLLLGRAANTLLLHGVWRIYCDTASENEPMIRLFETCGWTRRSSIEV